MFCPNLSDPNIKAQFESLQSIVPEYAYYLWDKYQGEVPAKYYNLANQTTITDKKYINSIADRFIRLERQFDFLKEIQNDPAYWKMSTSERRTYVAAKQLKDVSLLL